MCSLAANGPDDAFGLPASTVERLHSVFSTHPGIEEVVLYGSRAKGNYRTGSDIDVTVKGEVDWQELLQLEEQIDELLLPYKVDLSLYAHIDNPALLEHIRRVGKPFYKRHAPK